MTSHGGQAVDASPAIDAYASNTDDMPKSAQISPGSVIVGFLDGGTWSACFGLSYRDLCLADMASSGRVVRPDGMELRAVTGAGGIPGSRNQIVKDFLARTDGEWLWFIDTDMGFAPDTVDRLVAAAHPEARPVVGGLCFAGLRLKSEGAPALYRERYGVQPTIYEWVELPDEVGFRPILGYPKDTIIQCAATGAACLLIHRTVLEKMRATSGEAWFDPITHPTGKAGKPRTFSEDMSFCIRLAGVGIPLYVDTSVKTVHEKGMAYLDEDFFQSQYQ